MSSYPYSSRSPGANAPAIVTVQGRTGARVVVSGIIVSYNAAPTAGNFTILGNNSNRGYDFDISAAGPLAIPNPEDGMEFDVGESVTATLAAAGAAVVGKVNLAVQWQSET